MLFISKLFFCIVSGINYHSELLIQVDMICTGSFLSNALSGPLTVRVPSHDKNLY